MKFYTLTFNRRTTFLLIGLITFLTLFGANAMAAVSGGELDASFNPLLLKDNQASINSILVQPDGKILCAGVFLNINLTPRSYLARFNPDGTLDASFDTGGTFAFNSTVNSMALQADGKIVAAGIFDTIGGQTRKNIARFNSDGSFDPTFNVVLPSSSGAFTSVIAQTDGKILFSGNFSTVGGQTRNGFARVNADGSLDTAYNPPCFNGGVLSLQADGKVLIGNNCGSALNGGVARLTTAGAVDATFNVGTGANGSAVQIIVPQTNGKIFVGGQFSTFNGQARNGIVRVNADGTIDTTFVPSTDFATKAFAIQPDGKIVIARSFGFQGINSVYRLNTDGSNDASFNANQTQVGGINALVIAPDGSIYEGGQMTISGANFSVIFKPLLRLNANAMIDTAFDPYVAAPNLSAGINNVVAQPDGKILVAGQFSEVNRQARQALVRFNADGSLDSTFNLGASTGIFNGTINAMALQADGKIVVGSTLPNGAADRLQRLNADGSRDASFNVPLDIDGDVRFIALQPDGRILVAGNFVTIGGQSRRFLARINSNSSVDSFNPNLSSSVPNIVIASLLAQPDGKFLVGGTFTQVNGTSRNGAVRFNADGTLDSGFADNTVVVGVPNYLAIQPDGKIIYIQGSNDLARLNTNGTQDTSFTPPRFRITSNDAGSVVTVAVQSNGKILVGGVFNYAITPTDFPFRKNLARLNANGSFDYSFGSYGGTTPDNLYKIALQADGKILLGGSFRMVNGFGHSGLARLNQSVLQSNRFSDFDGDGRSDAVVFRSGNWYIQPSSGGNFYGVPFGLATDKLAPADYDGDGRTDVAVWREGGFSNFYVLQSATNTFRAIQFGTTGDVRVAGDWDGDGKADAAVYRNGAAGGQSFFYFRPSSQAGVDFNTFFWGTGGDVPARGDFDGDGRLDAAVFRPSTATWYIRQSSNGQLRTEQFGLATDKLVPADYDGDGKTDVAIFRNGNWYIKQSTTGQVVYRNWGASSDTLVPADYDGDGRADVAVYRNGIYYIQNSSSATNSVLYFGAAGDAPIAAAYNQ